MARPSERQLPARRRTTVTTTESEHVEGDPIRARLRKRLAEYMSLNAEAYCRAYWEAVSDVSGTKLLVMKKVGGVLSKVGEMLPGETDPKDTETWIMQEWQDGAYQLQPEIGGRMYGPASKVFRFGSAVPEERPPRVEQDTIDAEINAATKRLGHVAALAKLKDVVGEAKKGDEGMDMAGIAALMQAQQAPILKMLEASEARAARAEERLEKMLDRIADQRTQATQASAPLFGELLKTAVGKPEILSLLLNPAGPAPERNWLDSLRDIAQEFSPYLQEVVKTIMARGGVAALPAGAPGGAVDVMPAAGPRPTVTAAEGDGGAMPMPLNEEQTMAKDMLVDFVVKGDFANAYAVLESFPGFMPVQGGAMPLGEFIISKIDPAVNPRVYLPQLGMLIPDLRKTLPQAEAFVKYVQDRIVADDEAARRASSAPDPKPTTGGE